MLALKLTSMILRMMNTRELIIPMHANSPRNIPWHKKLNLNIFYPQTSGSIDQSLTAANLASNYKKICLFMGGF